jgi:dihydroorotase
MSDAPKTPDAIRLLAEQQGLAKALKLYPDGVTAAAERGLKPLGASPKGTTSISSPAPVFNPARFEPDE